MEHLIDGRPPLPIPVAEEILVASALGDHSTVIELIERAPIDAWFGVAPDRFRTVLAHIPEEQRYTGVAVPSFSAFLGLGGPGTEGTAAGAPRSATSELSDMAARTFGARVRGRPVESVRLMSRSRGLADTANALFDDTLGWHGFLAVQQGISEMLTGDFSGALDSFGSAVGVPMPDQLGLIRRDAYVKAALIHALFGDPEDARHHLDSAARIPPVDSWAEAGITAHSEIAAALVAEPDAEMALARLKRVAPWLLGEMWPFWLEAADRLAARAGHQVAERRHRVDRMARATPAHLPGDGYPGSVLALLHARQEFDLGDTAQARHFLAQADESVLCVRLSHAILDIGDGDVDEAIGALVALRSETRDLLQVEMSRQTGLAWALLRRGDRAGAAEALRSVHRMREAQPTLCPAEIPAEVDALGVAEVPGWTPAPHPRATSAPETRPKLSERELVLLRALASGRRRSEIAEDLFVSMNTVKTQQRAIYRKLGVSSRTDALLQAESLRLI
ncbi:helix-turn-helix transcriptional regulator [Microbacterium caowuchunii]|uniref:Response regulator transcription factor n=1 Tax=Microbacterium caowuchunii TaxID=2614638 RepID=A0A5N0TBI4_9MICO|nr:LuxR C-terminal-related transcriptional regulator [Microbacterium caowuchunii]KAA9132385.1 response regulator transcription factor [Microbacterium caowuchunii]